jgi:hypothetical protein
MNLVIAGFPYLSIFVGEVRNIESSVYTTASDLGRELHKNTVLEGNYIRILYLKGTTQDTVLGKSMDFLNGLSIKFSRITPCSLLAVTIIMVYQHCSRSGINIYTGNYVAEEQGGG